jgi:predicted permease
MNDFRFALRQLRKSPGFSLLAVLTLTVGIGMNTAIFSLINDLFLRGLPFEKPGEIVRVFGEDKGRDLTKMPFSIPRYQHYRDSQTVFSGIAADMDGVGYILTGMGNPVQLRGGHVTANYFDLLGVRPVMGRLFLPEEEMSAEVVVVTESFWKNRLGSDPQALGRSVTLNNVPTTIIGVVPNMPVAWFGRDAEIFGVKPLELPGVSRDLLMRGVSYLRVIGRLKPGVTIEQARAALPAVHGGYRAQRPDNADNSWQPVVINATEDITGDLRPTFLTLMAAAGAVLLIACSNVINLFLVRFSGRRREIALRMALGGSHASVVRLFVIESTLIGILAGLTGTFLARLLISLIPLLEVDNLPLEPGARLHWPVLAFALLLSVLTGLGIGAYPAWLTSMPNLMEGLKEGGRSMSGSLVQQRFRRVLVAAQVTISLVLFAGAALLIASFLRLNQVESGIEPDGIWVGGINLPPANYPDPEARARFGESLRSELLSAPGIQSVALSDVVPLTGHFSSGPYAHADGNPPALNERPLGNWHSISPGYLRTFGIPLLAGRDIDERDGFDRPFVVLISRATARKLFPNEDALGREMLFGSDKGVGSRAQIVGVVGDVRSVQLSKLNEVESYRPWSRRTDPNFQVSVRSTASPDLIAATVRKVLNRLDPGLAISQPTTMPAIIAASLGRERLTMTLLGSFAAAAFLLSMVGIYGAVAFSVEQRMGEIGVRIALGAQTRDVVRLVVRQGMTPVLIGLGVGMLGTLALSGLLRTQLYEVSPYNPSLLAVSVAAVAIVAVVACLIPARRALLVSPLEALRTE